MNDQSAPTSEDIRNARTVAGLRLLARSILDPDADPKILALSIKADLTDDERALMVGVLLKTFAADQAERVCQTHFAGAGHPGASLMPSSLADARFWAECANTDELKSYALASFEKMTPTMKAAFIKWAGTKV